MRSASINASAPQELMGFLCQGDAAQIAGHGAQSQPPFPPVWLVIPACAPPVIPPEARASPKGARAPPRSSAPGTRALQRVAFLSVLADWTPWSAVTRSGDARRASGGARRPRWPGHARWDAPGSRHGHDASLDFVQNHLLPELDLRAAAASGEWLGCAARTGSALISVGGRRLVFQHALARLATAPCEPFLLLLVHESKPRFHTDRQGACTEPEEWRGMTQASAHPERALISLHRPPLLCRSPRQNRLLISPVCEYATVGRLALFYQVVVLSPASIAIRRTWSAFLQGFLHSMSGKQRSKLRAGKGFGVHACTGSVLKQLMSNGTYIAQDRAHQSTGQADPCHSKLLKR